MRCTGFVISKLLDAVLLVELINTAAGVDQLLLAGVEGVALGADFNGDVLLGGAGLDDGAASALDSGLLVLRMDSFLHGFVSSSCTALIVRGRIVTRRKWNCNTVRRAMQVFLRIFLRFPRF